MATAKKVDVFRGLPDTSMLRMFNVLEEDGERYVNIFRGLAITDDVLNNQFVFNEYQMEEEDWWENISYEHYKTVYLWWLVCMFNGIINPYEETQDGQYVKILSQDYIYQIFDDIRDIEDL